METISGTIETLSINPEARRISLILIEEDGRRTEAVASGQRAIDLQAILRCGQRITLRGFERQLAGGGLEFVIREVWTTP